MCFTETYMHGSNFTEISNYLNGWKDDLRFVLKSNLWEFLKKYMLQNNRDLNISTGHQRGTHFAYITLLCSWYNSQFCS